MTQLGIRVRCTNAPLSVAERTSCEVQRGFMSTRPSLAAAPTDAEMTAARKALEQWQTPEAFVSKVESFAPLVKSSVLFNRMRDFCSTPFQLLSYRSTAR